MEILLLSQNISSYLNHDLCSLNADGTEDKAIYFTGDIIQYSHNLAPEIIKAEQARFSEKKYKHIDSLNKLTYRIYKNCKRLEHTKSNGKDFLPILKKELNKFRKLQRNWILTL